MAHTYSNLLYHIVFSTKQRVPQIDDRLKTDLWPYMGGIVKEIKGSALLVNGTEDHVHLLMVLPSVLAVSDTVRTIKANSSRWIHEKWPQHRSFAWQTGYGAFTVSESSRSSVRQYIAKQEEHHREMSF